MPTERGIRTGRQGDLLLEVKLVLRYSNVEPMLGQVVQLCDKNNSRQAIQVVADQDSINAALQGHREVTLSDLTAFSGERLRGILDD